MMDVCADSCDVLQVCKDLEAQQILTTVNPSLRQEYYSKVKLNWKLLQVKKETIYKKVKIMD